MKKLSRQQVKKIREMYGTGKYTLVELAKYFPVKKSTVWNVVNGVTY